MSYLLISCLVLIVYTVLTNISACYGVENGRNIYPMKSDTRNFFFFFLVLFFSTETLKFQRGRKLWQNPIMVFINKFSIHLLFEFTVGIT